MADLRDIPENIKVAALAVRYGMVWNGFDGPSGISERDAIEYAGELAEWVLGGTTPADHIRSLGLDKAK